MGMFYEFRGDMKRKMKQIICSLLTCGEHRYEKVTYTTGKERGCYNEINQYMYVCRRCGKVKWFWEG